MWSSNFLVISEERPAAPSAAILCRAAIAFTVRASISASIYGPFSSVMSSFYMMNALPSADRPKTAKR